MNTSIPAKLIIGDDEKVVAFAELNLQKEFCASKEAFADDAEQKGCFCINCRRIKNRQHPFLIWLSPEKDYKVDDVEIIFEKVSLALDEGQRFYFVLEKAHTLTGAVANRLLKVLEEPPRGYNFLLLAQNQYSILPTIISRCFIIQLSSSELTQSSHPLLNFFVGDSVRTHSTTLRANATDFEQELKRQDLTDSQSHELAQQLLNIFMNNVVSAYKSNNDKAEIEYDLCVIEYLQHKLLMPPQSGSSEIFWKNLFLNWPAKK